MKDIKHFRILESNKRWKKRNPDKVKESKKKYYQKNKLKIRQQKKEYWINHPEKARKWKLNPYYKKYKNFSLQKYDELFALQNGVCAICQNPEKQKRLAVDHCHTSNEVRGLLCQKCNRGIGLFNDNPGLLERAKNYLSTLH